MRITNLQENPKFYWTIQLFLIGPLILLWGGVAYWFGFGSEVIMRLVFPKLMAPTLLLVILSGAFIWTLLHLRNTPPERQMAWAIDLFLCGFILFSLFLLAGQIMSVRDLK